MNFLAIFLCSLVLGAGSQDTYADSSEENHEPEDIGSNFDGDLGVTECVEDCDFHEDIDSVKHNSYLEDSIYTHEKGPMDPESMIPEFEEHVDYDKLREEAEHDEGPEDDEDSAHKYPDPSKYGEVPTLQDASNCPQDPITLSPYHKLCKQISLKLLQLEARYPELKSLKLELLQRLDIHASDFDIHLKEGESPVSKFLELFINIANQIKAESESKRKITEPIEEIIAEDEPEIDIGFVGSVRGIPGVHYPNYTEVPITSFSCSDKKFIPGFYADLEAGCQVFHVCYEHRRESFLCPLGTIFNQPILACDYWYSSNCSQAPSYYDVNLKKEDLEVVDEGNIGDLITTIIEKKPALPVQPVIENDLKDIVKFLPVKAKITEYPKDKVSVPSLKGFLPKPMKIPFPFAKIVPVPAAKFIVKPKIAKIPIVKAKLAKAAVVDVSLAKAKLAKATTAKAKLAKAAAVDVALAKAKLAKVTTAKAKLAKAVAVDVALAKAKLAKAATAKAKLAKAAAVDVAKVKLIKAAVVPVIKAEVAAVPVIKAKKVVKYVKAAAKPKLAGKLALAPLKVKASVAGIPIRAKGLVISPLTKKALAMGYKKLLLSKKMILVG